MCCYGASCRSISYLIGLKLSKFFYYCFASAKKFSAKTPGLPLRWNKNTFARLPDGRTSAGNENMSDCK